MEDKPVNIIRESTRNLLKLNRQMLKEEASDTLRCIQELKVTEETIRDIVNKVKTKAYVSFSELQILKNCLVEDSNNIEIVLNIHGALRGIIRELTSNHIQKQVAAAGCCCNLALGDTRACVTVAKAAGSYLTTLLDNFATELAITCAWTIGNLAGCGPVVCEILVSQGALAKLAEFQNSTEMQDAALYALVHFAYQMRNDLRLEYLQKILETLTELDFTMASSQLLFILSCHELFSENVPDEMIQRLLDETPVMMITHIRTCPKKEVCCPLVHLIRVLANINHSYDRIVNAFSTESICKAFRDCLQEECLLGKSIVWLLANMFQFCDDKGFFYMLENSIGT